MKNMNESEVLSLHKKYLNSSYIDLIQSLGHGTYFKRATGTKIYDDKNVEYTDFLSGYGVHNIGHNNKELINHLNKELITESPSFLNMDAPIGSAVLAQKLTEYTNAQLTRVSYANSGSEIVEFAIKTARAATKRLPIISCKESYHGLSIGALSLMDDETHRKPFGDLLGNVHFVKFGDLNEFEDKVKENKPAAFIVEPIQSEGGIIIPSEDYFTEVSKICRKHNVLLIIDEVQTGIGRCGSIFRTDFSKFTPDILLIGKALSGGLIPISACIMTEEVYKKAHHGMKKCFLYSSTFAGGHLACQCAIKTLEIVKKNRLAEESNSKGNYLLEQLNQLKNKHKIIKGVRGAGLLIGVEFETPKGLLVKPIPSKIKNSFYTYIITAKLMQDYKLILQACSIKGEVLRIEPPLTITKEEIDFLIDSLDKTLTEMPNHITAWNKLVKNKLFRLDL